MAQKSNKITFASGISTKEALNNIVQNTGIVFQNTGRAIDNAAHKLPWVFIVIVIFASIAVNVVCIGQARAERDSYNSENVRLNMELSKYKALYNDRR